MRSLSRTLISIFFAVYALGIIAHNGLFGVLVAELIAIALYIAFSPSE